MANLGMKPLKLRIKAEEDDKVAAGEEATLVEYVGEAEPAEMHVLEDRTHWGDIVDLVCLQKCTC
ncbi:MAG: hypothetical protein ACREBR_01695 [bacterium]